MTIDAHTYYANLTSSMLRDRTAERDAARAAVRELEHIVASLTSQLDDQRAVCAELRRVLARSGVEG